MLLDKLRSLFGGELAIGARLTDGFLWRTFQLHDRVVYRCATTAIFDSHDTHWHYAQLRFVFEREERRAVSVRFQVERAIEKLGLSIRRLYHEEVVSMLSPGYGSCADGGQI